MLETAIYRVAQEAITNINKHASTDQVSMTLMLESSASPEHQRLVLEVQDWGQGFDFTKKADDPVHVGLRSMLERAILMGGTCEVDTAPGRGTRIHATFPIL